MSDDSQPALLIESITVGAIGGTNIDTGENGKAAMGVDFGGHMWVDGRILDAHSTVRIVVPFEQASDLICALVDALVSWVDRRLPEGNDEQQI